MALKLAIVGRPNVGKSTLFNRLAGRKLAIVDDRPGVTRDRRFGTGRIGDLDLELIDTAGFEDVADESLEARMRAQTELALDEADVALFVVDSRDGVTGLDEVFAEILRRRDMPVVLAANKAEGKAGDDGVLEAYGLGLGEPVPISAEHGEGMADLYAALIAVAADQSDLEDEAGDKAVKIAIVGRPNAGKSTLVNRLIGEDRLLTGPEAGITRDAIPVDWTWEDRPVRLVDTAGLRRRAKVQEKLEKLSTADTIRAITFAEVVILVMDATHPFEIQDLQIADLVEREGRGLVFVLAKWDLVADQQAKLAEFIEDAQRHLPQLRGAPVVALSAETGRGLEKLMPAVFKVHGDWSTKVKTRDLNDWLRMATERHPPPAVNGRRIKPKYMAQTKSRPPTFVLFASRADQLPDSYRRYLVNSIRESFDLPGVPIRVTVKSNKNPYAEGEEKAGQGSERAPFGVALPTTGLKAKTRIAAAAKAKAGAAGKSRAPGKSKAKPAKSGAPRGRAAKLARPGVKPKRASRPSSSPRRPR
ncbi:ribosome biogenesis GTPase Der [Phenylobacterium sp.]|jgi:GTP-binding protein|uniref:ribosome biogenesis GTPase Der n=1 Tax=Phenylobacterium sp. TaxID=1871053 RepID=UPI002F42597B